MKNRARFPTRSMELYLYNSCYYFEFGKTGTLTSVIIVDFILYTGSPSAVCWSSERKTAIITGFTRNVVPSASQYKLQFSFASSISISVAFCAGSVRISLTIISSSSLSRVPQRVTRDWSDSLELFFKELLKCGILHHKILLLCLAVSGELSGTQVDSHGRSAIYPRASTEYRKLCSETVRIFGLYDLVRRLLYLGKNSSFSPRF